MITVILPTPAPPKPPPTPKYKNGDAKAILYVALQDDVVFSFCDQMTIVRPYLDANKIVGAMELHTRENVQGLVKILEDAVALSNKYLAPDQKRGPEAQELYVRCQAAISKYKIKK